MIDPTPHCILKQAEIELQEETDYRPGQLKHGGMWGIDIVF